MNINCRTKNQNLSNLDFMIFQARFQAQRTTLSGGLHDCQHCFMTQHPLETNTVARQPRATAAHSVARFLYISTESLVTVSLSWQYSQHGGWEIPQSVTTKGINLVLTPCPLQHFEDRKPKQQHFVIVCGRELFNRSPFAVPSRCGSFTY